MELDKDLASRQEARLLCRQAEEAQQVLAKMEQAQLDRICQAVAEGFAASAEELAQLAVQDTGFGNAKDKTIKNRFASQTVWESIRQMKAVGILREDSQQ